MSTQQIHALTLQGKYLIIGFLDYRIPKLWNFTNELISTIYEKNKSTINSKNSKNIYSKQKENNKINDISKTKNNNKIVVYLDDDVNKKFIIENKNVKYLKLEDIENHKENNANINSDNSIVITSIKNIENKKSKINSFLNKNKNHVIIGTSAESEIVENNKLPDYEFVDKGSLVKELKRILGNDIYKNKKNNNH